MSASTEPSAGGVASAANAQPRADRAAARAFWLVSGGVLAFWAAHNALLLPWEERELGPAVREPAQIALRAVLWITPAVLYLRRHDPRPLLVALGVTSRVARRGLAQSAVAVAIYFALIFMLLRATNADASAAWVALERLSGAPLQLVYMVLRAALEELLMRGFLLGQLVRLTSSVRAQVVVAVLFALMHVPAWIAMQGLDIGLVPSLIAVLVLGAVLGAVARASNNIAPAIVVHWANNLLGELMGG
jgi:membrane protease YdiL (CAAX protease family)